MAGGECQARKSDHRVAAPIAEPVIAGNDAVPIGLAGNRALYYELVRSENELREPCGIGIRFRRRRMDSKRCQKAGIVSELLGESGISIEKSILVRGEDQRERFAEFDRGAELRGKEMIFVVV